MGLYNNNNNNNLGLLGTTPNFFFWFCFFCPVDDCRCATEVDRSFWTRDVLHWQIFIDNNRDLCIVQATPALRSCVRSIAKPKAQGLRPSHRSSCSSSNWVASLKTPLKSASMKMASCEFHSPPTRTEVNAKSHATDF